MGIMMPRRYAVAIVLVALASAVFSAVTAPRIPDPAPIHWSLENEIDGYGPRWLAVGVFPALVAAFAALFLVLPRIGPLRENFERSAVPYARIALALVVLVAALGALFQMGAAGATFEIGPPLFLLLGLLLAFIGSALRDVRRNHWVGIRTPWTLESDAVWAATNRLGGRLMIAHGFLVAAGAFLLPAWGGLALLRGGHLLLVVWALVHSCRTYRRLGGDRPAPEVRS
jgi:uncharacterized membrane protein